MNKLTLLLHYLYSFLFCLRYLPLKQALSVPILIDYSVKIKGLSKGAISFSEKPRHGMIVLGFEGSVGRSHYKSLISISKGGKFILGNNVQMAKGFRLVIGEKGRMKIGNHFWCNGDCYFNCTKDITIGNDNMYGWNINFNTTDGHHIIENGIRKSMDGDIAIGNHVWIASNCDISKNVYVPDDCVVAQKSLLSKRYEQPNCLIGGTPAKILKNDINWEA